MVKALGACAVLLVVASAAHAGLPVMKLQPFDLKDVRLLDGPCKVGQDANARYLLSLDPDRLLYNFRVNAGLPAPGKPLGGWEAPNCEVRGHFVGHYLSACALMYASTGDEAFKARADLLVAEMSKCQQALGGGYLSAYPAAFFDRLEAMQNPPWAPYYTIHKIMAGLFDVYTYCGNQQALDIVKGMAAYFKARIDKLSDFQMDATLAVEFGGMSEVLANLYGVTKNPDHLALAHRFERYTFFGPLALEHDDLTNIHANTHIPQICGAARRYELTDTGLYGDIVKFFWDSVANHRSYATGGSNVGEGWGEPDKLAHTLAANNQELCTTYNILKVTRYILRWHAEAAKSDFYERAFFNGILGAQDPKTGMLIYYLPLATGLAKTYSTPEDSFWCCTGTGVETFAKLGDSIYFHDAGGLYVSLFIPSTVEWRDKKVRVEQTTAFPDEDRTQLVVHVAKPTTFALNVRVPSWASGGVTAAINGKPVPSAAKPLSWLAIKREWKDGDRVEIIMLMALHARPMPDDANLVAAMYGPLVLAGLTDKPAYFLGDPANVSSWLKPVPGKPLTFRTEGQPVDLTFIPLDRIIHEQYGVYFKVVGKGSPEHQKILAEEEVRRQRLASFVDVVHPNDAASETAHNLQGQNHGAGTHMGRGWRHAPDGWFSYDLKVLPDVPMILVCNFWGSDAGNRAFDVLVDGQKIASVSLQNNKPGEFFDVEYAIPPELTRGKDKITVRFQAHQGNIAGGVFECATRRAK
jgi:hypothetical protein